MKRSFRSAAAALSAVLVFGMAAYGEEQYQTEVTAFGSRTNGDQGSRTTVYGGTGEVFFSPVNTEEHPYAEAAFLERVGSVRLFGEQAKFEGELKGDGPVFGIGANLAKPDFPLTLELMYTRAKIDIDESAGGAGTLKHNTADVRLGNYFTKTLRAGLEYAYGSTEMDLSGGSATVRARDYGVFAKYVIELGDFREVSIEADLFKSTLGEAETLRNTNEAIAVDYYFNKSLSVGAGFENSNGTDEAIEGKTYSGNVRYFFTPRFSVQGIYDRFRNSNDGRENERTYEVVLAGRF